MTGYRSRKPNKNGKYPLVFKPEDGQHLEPVNLPCGGCSGCRLDYSRDWAIRCVHEAQMHEENAFITLTYNDENLPEDKSIHKETLQKFFKRLRKKLGTKIRYFACGEYGDQNGRPHYHAIIFGYDFPDKKLWRKTKSGNLIHRSKLLEEVWTYGYSSIGEVTFQSAAYVARYVMKKAKGKTEKAKQYYKERYNAVDTETGELMNLEPEFCLMSRGRRPDGGIGYRWLQKYKGDTDKDFVTVNGSKVAIPKYYDQYLEELDPDEFEIRKEKRRDAINRDENKPNRLRQRKIVKEVQISQLKRGLE